MWKPVLPSFELGMRACLCYEVSERDGAEKCAQSIQENAGFAKWAEAENSDMKLVG